MDRTPAASTPNVSVLADPNQQYVSVVPGNGVLRVEVDGLLEGAFADAVTPVRLSSAGETVPVLGAQVWFHVENTSSGGGNCFVDVQSSSCSVTGLANGRVFDVYLRARNADGWSAWVLVDRDSIDRVDRTPAASTSPALPGTLSLEGNMVFGQLASIMLPRVGGTPQPDITATWFRCNGVPPGSPFVANGCELIEEQVADSGLGNLRFEYSLGAEDVGKHIAVEVVASNLAGTDKGFAVGTEKVSSPPEFVGEHVYTHFGTAPGLDSTVHYPTVGQFIGTQAGANLGTNGGWVSYPLADFSYQWFMCDSEIGSVVTEVDSSFGCDTFGNPDSRILQLPEESVGRFVAVQVTGRNTIGGEDYETTLVMPSAPVVGQPLDALTAPSFAGTPLAPVQQENEDLGVVSLLPGDWLGYPAPDFTVEWSICGKRQTDVFASWNCDVVADGSALEYQLQANDYSQHFPSYLYARVVAENPINRVEQVVGGLETLSAPFRWGPPPPIDPKDVDGAAALGVNDVFPWFYGTPEPDTTITWLRCDSSLANWSSLHNEICITVGMDSGDNSYIISSADFDKHIVAVVSGQNAWGEREFRTDSFGPIQPIDGLGMTPSLVGPFYESDVPKLRIEMTDPEYFTNVEILWSLCDTFHSIASYDLFDGEPTPEMPSQCSELPYKNNLTLWLHEDYIGGYLVATVSIQMAMSQGGKTTVVHTLGLERPIEPSDLPELLADSEITISGHNRVGGRLTTSIGLWGDEIEHEIQWLRGGEEIPGANLEHYTLTPDDEGTEIGVTLKAMKPGHRSARGEAVLSSLTAPLTCGNGPDFSVTGSRWVPGTATRKDHFVMFYVGCGPAVDPSSIVVTANATGDEDTTSIHAHLVERGTRVAVWENSIWEGPVAGHLTSGVVIWEAESEQLLGLDNFDVQGLFSWDGKVVELTLELFELEPRCLSCVWNTSAGSRPQITGLTIDRRGDGPTFDFAIVYQPALAFGNPEDQAVIRDWGVCSLEVEHDCSVQTAALQDQYLKSYKPAENERSSYRTILPRTVQEGKMVRVTTFVATGTGLTAVEVYLDPALPKSSGTPNG